MKFDKNKLLNIKNSFLEKKYSQCEHLIEELGSLENFQRNINFYSTSKLLNKSSIKKIFSCSKVFRKNLFCERK